MERVVKKRILEDPERLLTNLAVDNMHPSTINDLLDHYLRYTKVQNLYKMAIDIKSSKCAMLPEVFGVYCKFPISDNLSIDINLLQESGYDVDIFISARKEDKPINSSLTYQEEFHSNDIKRTMLNVLRKLGNEFRKELNFKILKEYLEEEE